MDLTTLANTYNSDKGDVLGEFGHAHRYAHIYEKFFSSLREKEINLIEIGVHSGVSLKLWETYFPKANILGIDINPDCAKYASNRSKIEIGDASDPDFLLRAINKHFSNPIDIIIDDGSHQVKHQIIGIIALFPYLAENGLYFIEDICASRFAEFKPTESNFFDFLDFAAFLSEQTTFFDKKNVTKYHSITDIRGFSDQNKVSDLNYFNENLFSVQIYHNLCLLIKQKRIFPYNYDISNKNLSANMDILSKLCLKTKRNYTSDAYENLEHRYNQLKQLNDALLNSRSWHITKPLRWFMRKVKAIARVKEESNTL